MLVITQALKNKLGKRISGVVDDKSYNLNIFVSPEGKVKTITIVLNSVYQNDPTVKESFLFGWEKPANEFRVQQFNINSTKLIQ